MSMDASKNPPKPDGKFIGGKNNLNKKQRKMKNTEMKKKEENSRGESGDDVQMVGEDNENHPSPKNSPDGGLEVCDDAK